MKLVTMSGPGSPSLALQIIDAQRLATPSMTWKELIQVWPELWKANTEPDQRLNGWLSDLGHVVASNARTAGNVLGLGEVTKQVTGILDAVGHSIEDSIGGQINDTAKTEVAKYLSSDFAKSNSKWILIAVVVVVFFLLRGRR